MDHTARTGFPSIGKIKNSEDDDTGYKIREEPSNPRYRCSVKRRGAQAERTAYENA